MVAQSEEYQMLVLNQSTLEVIGSNPVYPTQKIWPFRLAVQDVPISGRNRGSNPLRATNKTWRVRLADNLHFSYKSENSKPLVMVEGLGPPHLW